MVKYDDYIGKCKDILEKNPTLPNEEIYKIFNTLYPENLEGSRISGCSTARKELGLPIPKKESKKPIGETPMTEESQKITMVQGLTSSPTKDALFNYQKGKAECVSKGIQSANTQKEFSELVGKCRYWNLHPDAQKLQYDADVEEKEAKKKKSKCLIDNKSKLSAVKQEYLNARQKYNTAKDELNC